ncbi:beta strand repeat-containing protein, partial [Methylosoma difficile]
SANLLDGGAGADSLAGGLGNDSYVVDDLGDTVTETSTLATEIDNVSSSVSFVLGANLENLALTGTTAINATGNGLNNALLGNDGNNVLDGKAGADTMSGGLGNDSYTVDNSGDTITETSTLATEVDSVSSSVSFVLSDNVENLTLTGGKNLKATGNAKNNVLKGNAGSNTLDGKAGADNMSGGTGKDTYMVDNVGDKVTETSTLATEVDTVISSVSFTLGANLENLTLTGTANSNATGNSLNNTLVGNDGNNVLDGGAGADSLAGGLGNDSYVVDDAGDTVTETSTLATEIDSVSSAVSFTLGDNVENLTLTGTANSNATGNSLNNTLVGNDGNNVLDGGAGADTMAGGLGNDSYVVDDAGDTVTETSTLATEIDSVSSSVSFVLGANLENLNLTGTANINATGNSLNNVLVGNDGNNILDGGAGADNMAGGLGNDSYVVDNTGDGVTETSTLATEIDSVSSSFSFVLGANLENLTLTGTAANATGNSLNNVLTGNASTNALVGGTGNDTLVAEEGADVLTGGTGKDALNLAETVAKTDTVKIATGHSTVTDFDVISGFQKGLSASSAAGVDKLDLVSTS